MTVLSGARVVTPDGIADWVELSGDRIVASGDGVRPGHDLGGGWLLPGFIDLHVHGGGGHDYAASDLSAGVAFHRSHGTTRTLISLVTAPPAALHEQLARVADLAADPCSGVLGAHLEGPFLAASRCGAQHPDHLLAPDTGVLAGLLRAGRGQVRVMTLAPELPGAPLLIDALVADGVVAAIGHTDATYAQAAAAFERGARLVTHAFNGMRSAHHREPGPVPAALDAGVACEVIGDGVHVHPAAVRLVARSTAPLVLVTDAIGAAGAGDGAYSLGGRPVTVESGQARLADGGNLAGSTLTMDEAVRRAIVDVGLSVVAASAAASGAPAALLGVGDRYGAIASGLAADLVLLDDDYRLRAVMVAGSWL